MSLAGNPDENLAMNYSLLLCVFAGQFAQRGFLIPKIWTKRKRLARSSLRKS